MLQPGYPPTDLAEVKVCVSGEVLADGGLGVPQSAVEGGAADTDDDGNQTEEEEQQTGVATANFYTEKPTIK